MPKQVLGIQQTLNSCQLHSLLLSFSQLSLLYLLGSYSISPKF